MKFLFNRVAVRFLEVKILIFLTLSWPFLNFYLTFWNKFLVRNWVLLETRPYMVTSLFLNEFSGAFFFPDKDMQIWTPLKKIILLKNVLTFLKKKKSGIGWIERIIKFQIFPILIFRVMVIFVLKIVNFRLTFMITRKLKIAKLFFHSFQHIAHLS